jgi:hypothetical protein
VVRCEKRQDCESGPAEKCDRNLQEKPKRGDQRPTKNANRVVRLQMAETVRARNNFRDLTLAPDEEQRSRDSHEREAGDRSDAGHPARSWRDRVPRARGLAHTKLEHELTESRGDRGPEKAEEQREIDVRKLCSLSADQRREGESRGVEVRQDQKRKDRERPDRPHENVPQSVLRRRRTLAT